MANRASTVWISRLRYCVDLINNSIHSRMKIAPIKINRNNEKRILRQFYTYPVKYSKPKYRINQYVRTAEPKNVFDKSYFSSYSPQIFRIININNKYPVTYKLVNFEGKLLPRAYYEPEIKAVKYNNVYLIREILQRKGNKVKVGWLGFDSKYDSWVNSSDIIDVSQKKFDSE